MPRCDLCRDANGVREYDDDGDPIALCHECAFFEGFTDRDPENGTLNELTPEEDDICITAADYMRAEEGF